MDEAIVVGTVVVVVVGGVEDEDTGIDTGLLVAILVLLLFGMRFNGLAGISPTPALITFIVVIFDIDGLLPPPPPPPVTTLSK